MCAMFDMLIEFGKSWFSEVLWHVILRDHAPRHPLSSPPAALFELYTKTVTIVITYTHMIRCTLKPPVSLA